ncbi:alcohol dehydrogenase catalytic domain-containing protein [Nonomuraea sp. NEAU-A123]|nr:alcohol dehydrogenase catalytic domain-containing protein [Nonomuraea sp. NEAU-A123]
MRAVVLEQFGGPLVLTTIGTPVAGPGQVLVRVKASGVNPLDTKIRAGNAAHARSRLPAVLGMDLAGVAEQVGAGVTGFAPGDRPSNSRWRVARRCSPPDRPGVWRPSNGWARRRSTTPPLRPTTTSPSTPAARASTSSSTPSAEPPSTPPSPRSASTPGTW